MNYPPPAKLHDYRYLGNNFRRRERIKEESNVFVYHLIEDENITEIFKDELTETQKTILSLLHIQPEKYWLNKI